MLRTHARRYWDCFCLLRCFFRAVWIPASCCRSARSAGGSGLPRGESGTSGRRFQVNTMVRISAR